MKYSVIGNVVVSRSGKKRIIIKWLLYSLILIISYVIMRAGIIDMWQPVLLIPLSVAVSAREQELPSCIFALFCGLYIDIACGFLFGFSAFWLILLSLFTSLLSKNLVQQNFINFTWLTAAAIIVEFFMDYIFNIVLWDRPNYQLILTSSIIPSAVSTLILSPIIYLLVREINNKFGINGGNKSYEIDENTEDTDCAAARQ